MIHAEIGNWLITDEGIEWNGIPKKPYYYIRKESLNDVWNENGKKMYDWLLHMPRKGWIKHEDVFTLNTAYIYALEYFGIGFSSEISFTGTIIKQQEDMERRKRREGEKMEAQ
jgi:hypothetical protein